MEEQVKQHSGLRRWLRRLGWTFAGLLLLGILLRLSLKTSLVQQWAKEFAVSTANQQLNAELSIDRLSGDLWQEVTLSGIRLKQQDTLAQIDSVHAAYNIWALLGGRIEISQFGIYQPHLQLRQEGDKWNIQTVIPPSEDTASSASGLGWAIQLESFELQNGEIVVQSDSLPVEENFAIADLNLASKFKLVDESYDINVKSLSFAVENTQLRQPLQVQSSASAQQNRITLEKLVMATGNSMLQSSGFVTPGDSTVQLDFSASPVAWSDITAYAHDFPLRQDVQVGLGLQGNPEDFRVSLNMHANGLDSLHVSSQFQWQQNVVLKEFRAMVKSVDPAVLVGDTLLPKLQDFEAQFTGSIALSEYQKGQGNFTFSALDISQSPYHLDQLSGLAKLQQDSAGITLEAQQGRQMLSSEISINELWEDFPEINGDIRGQNLDPAYWTQDTTLTGNISFQSAFSGSGWYPQKKPWTYSLRMKDAQLMGQSIRQFRANGQLSEQLSSLDAGLETPNGNVELVATFKQIMQNPEYEYEIRTNDLNIGGLMGVEDFNTSINGELVGDGRGLALSSMALNTSVTVDSSVVNGELIRNLSADMVIRDSVATVDSASLQSTIAQGSFGGRMNMLRPYDHDNELSLDVMISDLRALAPLADVQNLQAEGTVVGNLRPVENENLRFLGTLDLSEIKYNELFTAERAQGSVDLRMLKNISYLADLELTAPTFSGVRLQNLSLMTQGNFDASEDQAQGKYEFRFSSPNEGRIEQGGTYEIREDSAQILTTDFNIISDYRTLTLEESFELTFRNDTLRMDTMRVSSGDGPFLEVGIPIVTANEQRGFVRGESLNTAVIQSSLLGEMYFDGMLSGNFSIFRKDTSLQSEGELLLSELVYEGVEIDSLLITGNINNERLQGTLSLRQDGKVLVDGNTNLPFKLGDPEQLPESFFKEDVQGRLQVRDVDIDRFNALFAEAGITETSGIFSLRGRLNGSAGEPELSADATLKNAQLSGVSVDSVTAGLNYSHQDAEVRLDASVLSLKQRAAQIDAQFPLFINMKTFGVDMPGAKDSIAVDVQTNNFNLAAVNDFLDPQTLRNVTGQLDGMVHVTGAVEDLKTDGKLELQNGGFRLVPAGVQIEDVKTSLIFDPNQIRLANFSAQSGTGSLTASGAVEMEELVPGNINFKVRGKNFRVANTSQNNVIVNLDAKAQGSVTEPKVSGSLSLVRGFITLQNFGEKSVETIQLDSVESDEPSVSIYDSLALDMSVNFDPRFRIRNEQYLEMEVELDGSLDLIKQKAKDLELFGTITTPSGYARPFGKEFELQEGQITFDGPPANPQLAIRTRYEPPQTQEDITIWYVIEGRVEKPQFKYESQPPMELENIISYTLFGQPFYALNSWKQVVASSGSNTTAADVALDVVLDRVEALATQKLGIDVVKIDNSLAGGETGTSIVTGWYLNPKVFFAIQNVITGSTPDTSFRLEYMLRKNLKLILNQGNGIRQGVDIKWNYDY